MSQAFISAPYLPAPDGFKALYVTTDGEDVVERLVVGFKVLDDLSVLPVTLGSRPAGSILGTRAPSGVVESARFGTRASVEDFVAAVRAKFIADGIKAEEAAKAQKKADLDKVIADAKAKVAADIASAELRAKRLADAAQADIDKKLAWDISVEERQGVFRDRRNHDVG
jgi:hypothetical protein